MPRFTHHAPNRGFEGLAVLVLGCVVACGPLDDAAAIDLASARSWEEADALFFADPRWMGGDGALSIPLGDDETLWLFGDSFVATSPANDRTESELVRNTLAIQRGLDPTTAQIELVWRTEPDGSPGPFFVDEGPIWFWPGHGVRLTEGPLVVFMMAVRETPGEGLGFTEAGYRIVVVDNPDQPPLSWQLQWFDPGSPAVDPNVSLGTSVIREGDELLAIANARGSTHEGWLAKLSVADLLAGNVQPRWWAGAGQWLTADELGDTAPAVIVDDVGAENSVHFEPRIDAYLHVASRGFGATTIAVRTAPSLTGPFTAATDVFTPPESQQPDPFVYAAKAHPELTTGHPDELVVTYATNSFDFADLFTPSGQTDLYYPRFVILRFAD